jgi:hypothetical protein
VEEDKCRKPENLEVTVLLRDPGIDERIIFKWGFK